VHVIARVVREGATAAIEIRYWRCGGYSTFVLYAGPTSGRPLR
jgi:hypothetical protein